MSGTVKLRIRNEQATWVEEFEVTDCARCGIVFAHAVERLAGKKGGEL